MASTELRKKAVYFVIFAAVTIFVISSLPALELWLQTTLLPQFGLTFEKGWLLTEESSGLPMSATYVTAINTCFHIIRIVLWMALVIALVRFIAYLILRAAYRSSDQPEFSSLIKTVSSIVVYIIAFFIIFQTQFPDVPLSPLFTGSTILGIVVGLALQETLGNLFAGIAMQADQPFQVGDVVSITNRGNGVVENVSWRGVKIRTFQNKLLIISNAVMAKETIEVAPKGNLNARIVFFNTEYIYSPSRTIQLVRDAVRQVDNVTNKMRPVIRIRDLAASGLDWEVKYWLEDYTRYNDTDALIRQRIWYVFQREKINFAYPGLTLHKEIERPEIPLDEMVNTITDQLNEVSIFAPLSDEETEQLANASKTRIYAPGEAIVRKGQEGNSMFIIIRGSVKVQIPENGYQKILNRLRESEFFGEMSLLTGEPRTASVVAEEETEVLQIRKEALKPILENNPSLVQAICELIDERREALFAQTQDEVDESPTSRKGVLGSIRRFFGLR